MECFEFFVLCLNFWGLFGVCVVEYFVWVWLWVGFGCFDGVCDLFFYVFFDGFDVFVVDLVCFVEECF